MEYKFFHLGALRSERSGGLLLLHPVKSNCVALHSTGL